jgi:hypothetical protein
MKRNRLMAPAVAIGAAALYVLTSLAAADPGRPGPVRLASRPARQAASQPARPVDAETAEFFEKQVRPVLAERCYGCHGPNLQQVGLRLDSRAAMLKGTRAGHPVLVPGDQERSRLIQAVRYNGAVRMPPAGKLPPGEIEALARWVGMGAPWPSDPVGPSPFVLRRSDWAFQPVKLPRVPAVPAKWVNTPHTSTLPPSPRAWVRSPIDAFILARLEAKGLAPAPPADRRALIRRARFDLTGLPPTPEEVAAFVADRSPDAFARVVDRLLASPQFGERWGRHWLDLVRYCDSFDARLLGEQNAGRIMDATEAWRYRDWVIRAFNEDLPYDQFIVQQIAGDILWERKLGSEDAIVATGMLAIGNWGGGDADKEKLLTDIADDQVDVVSRAFMGLTVACARCHDHKFDPITTKDYYALAGIFFSTHILENVGPKTNGPPMLRIPILSRAEAERRERYMARVAELEKQLKATRDERRAALARELAPQVARYALAAWESSRSAVPLAEFAARRGLREFALRQWREYLGLEPFRLLANAVRDSPGLPGVRIWRGDADCPNVLINTTDQELSILTFRVPPKAVTVHPGPASGVAVGWRSPVSATVRISGRVTDADPVGGDGIAWILDHQRGAAAAELATGAFPNGGAQDFVDGQGGNRLSEVAVKAGEEIRLTVLPKGDYGFDTTVVELRIATADGQRAWTLAGDLVADPLQGNPHADGYGNAAVWSFYEARDPTRPTSAPEGRLAQWERAVASGERRAIDEAAAQIQKDLDPADPRSPFRIRRAEDDRELPEPARAAIGGIESELASLKRSPPPPIPYANGAQEGGVPGSPHAGVHDVQVHLRGRYDHLGDLVRRGFPAVLAGDRQPLIAQGSGRLELARWLARGPQAGTPHPLTARVMVNRVWQHLFGHGIVRTPGNFGKLGERPTHPELLDWLASALVSGDALEYRSDGALDGSRLSRSHRSTTPPLHHSVPASFPPSVSPSPRPWSLKGLIRLIMLSAAYQQSSVAPGRSLKADPDNRLFSRMERKRLEAEAIRDNLLTVSGRLDPTPGGVATRDFSSPRRSVYQMIVRSDRSGFGPLFDVADPTASVDQRTESTVAPQALFMWNHPFVLEQARALAKRLLAGAPGEDRPRIGRAYALLYARPPRAEEIRVGLEFLARARAGALQGREPRSDVIQSAFADRENPQPAPSGFVPSDRHFHAGQAGSAADERAWTEYALVLLCANEFVYVD